MAYLTDNQLGDLGFKSVGVGVKISDKAAIYDTQEISIGDYSRIDDFCIISGRVDIGNYCHITPGCLIAGGKPGVMLSDFVTLAYGVKVFAQSDDYSGATMVGSLVPKRYKKEIFAAVALERQVIVGAGSVIMPGVTIKLGCSIGAMSLVNRTTQEWGVYVGIPARRLKDRSDGVILLEEEFLKEVDHDSV